MIIKKKKIYGYNTYRIPGNVSRSRCKLFRRQIKYIVKAARLLTWRRSVIVIDNFGPGARNCERPVVVWHAARRRTARYLFIVLTYAWSLSAACYVN